MTPDRLAELKARASRPRRTVPVVCNGDLAEQIANVQDDLAALDKQATTDRRLASKSNTARAAELEAREAELYAQAEADTILFVVEGLHGTAFRALKAQYPPKPGPDGKPLPGFDGVIDREASEVPLIRACVIGTRATVDSQTVDPLPDGTLEWLLGTPESDDEPAVDGFASVEQRESLWVAAWLVCRGDDAVPLRRRRSTTASSAGE